MKKNWNKKIVGAVAAAFLAIFLMPGAALADTTSENDVSAGQTPMVIVTDAAAVVDAVLTDAPEASQLPEEPASSPVSDDFDAVTPLKGDDQQETLPADDANEEGELPNTTDDEIAPLFAILTSDDESGTDEDESGQNDEGDPDEPTTDPVTNGECGDGLTWSFSDTMLSINHDGALSGAMTNYTSQGDTPWSSLAGQIQSIHVNSGVTSIGDYAFSGLHALISVILPDTLTSIGNYAFAESGTTMLSTIALPQSVQSIGEDAFNGCTSLETMTIPGSVSSLPTSCFAGCTSLHSIQFDGAITVIGDSAFEGCTALTSFDLPNSVTSLGASAFQNCTSLNAFSFNSGIRNIGANVFEGCTTLESASGTVSYNGTKHQFESNVLDNIAQPNDVLLEKYNANTIYWGVQSYTIEFDANGGSVNTGEANPSTMQTNDQDELDKLPTPTWDNHVFEGWYTERVGGTLISEGYVFEQSMTVYAHWTELPVQVGYTIFFDACNDSSTMYYKAQTNADGTLTDWPADPTWADHSFVGWYDAASGGNEYARDHVFGDNGTVYAHWQDPVVVQTFQVRFYPNGGSFPDGSTSTITVTTNDDGLVPAGDWPADPQLDGKKFQGWIKLNGQRFTESSTFTNDADLYADWADDEGEDPDSVFTITFETNGGKFADGSNSLQIKTDIEGFVPEGTWPADPQREGHKFVGWFDASAGEFSENSKFNANTDLHAEWEENEVNPGPGPDDPATITVTFDCNEGSLPAGVSPTVTLSSGGTLESTPTPTKSGYVFKGWYTDLEGGNPVTPSMTFTQDATIYAHWDPAPDPTPEKPTYQIIQGANSTWTPGDSAGLTIVSNGDFSLFSNVVVDGKTLVRGTDYTAVAGSTKITLLPAYLSTLAADQHTIAINYTDGATSTTSFAVAKGSENGDGSTAGDNPTSSNDPSDEAALDGTKTQVVADGAKGGADVPATGDSDMLALLFMAVLAMIAAAGLRKSRTCL